jgi:hypothetical protein
MKNYDFDDGATRGVTAGRRSDRDAAHARAHGMQSGDDGAWFPL